MFPCSLVALNNVKSSIVVNYADATDMKTLDGTFGHHEPDEQVRDLGRI